MKAWACTAVLVLVGASAHAAERIYTPEGWYQVEDDVEEGSGEEPLAIIIVEETAEPVEAQARTQQPAPGAPQVSPQPQPPPPPAAPDTLAEEIAEFRKVDCERVRGLYLRRLLELHGLDVGQISPESLAALTHQRPQSSLSGSCLGLGCLPPTPGLAPLYGEPPIHQGPLTYDLELKGLFADLLECQRQGREAATAPPAPPPAPEPTQAPRTAPSKAL